MEREQFREYIVDMILIEIEAWMDVHANRDRSFMTQDLIDHLDKFGKTL